MHTDLINRIKNMADIDIDAHSGSYILVRQGVARLSKIALENVDVSDLLMLFEFGNLGHGKIPRDEKIKASNLLEEDKQYMLGLNAQINSGNYTNHESKSNGNCGLFARGYRQLHINSDKETAQEFIEMLISISKIDDFDDILRIAGKCLSKNMKGMQAGVASQILHLLKPTVFPILNDPGRNGYINKLGLSLVKASDIRYYIQNVEIIHDFCNKEFPGKNLRTIDIAFWDIHDISLSASKQTAKELRNNMTINELLKSFQEYVSRAKPIGGTANSYATAMRDTLVYLEYKDNISIDEIPDLKKKVEDLNYEFENNLHIILKSG